MRVCYFQCSFPLALMFMGPFNYQLLYTLLVSFLAFLTILFVSYPSDLLIQGVLVECTPGVHISKLIFISSSSMGCGHISVFVYQFSCFCCYLLTFLCVNTVFNLPVMVFSVHDFCHSFFFFLSLQIRVFVISNFFRFFKSRFFDLICP